MDLFRHPWSTHFDLCRHPWNTHLDLCRHPWSTHLDHCNDQTLLKFQPQLHDTGFITHRIAFRWNRSNAKAIRYDSYNLNERPLGLLFIFFHSLRICFLTPPVAYCVPIGKGANGRNRAHWSEYRTTRTLTLTCWAYCRSTNMKVQFLIGTQLEDTHQRSTLERKWERNLVNYHTHVWIEIDQSERRWMIGVVRSNQSSPGVQWDER